MVSRKKNNEQFVTYVMSELMWESLCTNDPKEKAFLHKLLNNRKLVMKLLYRGSRDGWTPDDFHSLCDGESPTISLFKVKNGPCIGGYTEA
jgi:hypothetical protein